MVRYFLLARAGRLFLSVLTYSFALRTCPAGLRLPRLARQAWMAWPAG
jgi:hypothetical protein